MPLSVNRGNVALASWPDSSSSQCDQSYDSPGQRVTFLCVAVCREAEESPVPPDQTEHQESP